MRILKLRFKNLNSLSGEWAIDLTGPEFAGEGLFAITGPTGAGKSTILDAVCLALFSCTPRLGRITAGGNGIMSRRTGECFSEVCFETGQGRFACMWSQRRARGRAEGRLQAARHEISELDTGRVLDVRNQDVPGKVEELSGMNFERFTRSVLLAQNAFAAFLQASPDERAPILEQITGTEIYSRISVAAHERRNAEKQKLLDIQGRMDGLRLLGEEEEQALRDDLARLAGLSRVHGLEAEGLGRILAWLEGLAALEGELKDLRARKSELGERILAFEPERLKLARSDEATLLREDYLALVAERGLLRKDERSRKENLRLLAGERVLEKKAAALFGAAGEALREARENREALVELLKEIRPLDWRIEERSALLGKSEERVRELRKDRDDTRLQLDSGLAVLRRKQAELENALARLEKSAGDQGLVEGLSGLLAELGSLEKLRGQFSAVRAGLKAAEADFASALKAALEADSRLRELEKAGAVTSLEKEADRLKLIRDFSLARAELAPGRPCPLCGALEHPFAAKRVPDEEGALKKLCLEFPELRAALREGGAASVLSGLSGLFASVEKRRELAANAGRASLEAEHAARGAESRRDSVAGEYARLEKELSGAQEKMMEKLAPFGVGLSAGNAGELRRDLTLRQKFWQELERERAELEKRVASLQSSGQERARDLRRFDADLSSLEKECAESKDELAKLRRMREKLFGGKDPDCAEAELAAAVKKAEHDFEKRRGVIVAANSGFIAQKKRIADLHESIRVRRASLAGLENRFRARLAESPFPDEAAYLAACLSEEERAKLRERAGWLQREEISLTAREQEKEKRLSQEKEARLTSETPETLRGRLAALKELQAELLGSLGGLRQKLDDNDRAKTALAEQLELARRQMTELEGWNLLHSLIGSNDGKKYRNFAQGLTLDAVLVRANRQLAGMSDRYLLCRDPEQPLELCVIDHYQAGEVRSAKNLSGGESFIVSLALALGLSQIAGTGARVDSLFLDEGFGALDDDALDMALDTLGALRQDGKLIGVISHVPALRERINTQIRVRPLSEGRSSICGPGCSGG